MVRCGILLLLLVGLVACGEIGILVTEAEYGDAWPLTVSEARVDCLSAGALVAEIDGSLYAINGTAQARYPRIDPYWRDNAAIPGTKIPITPLIDRAKEACR